MHSLTFLKKKENKGRMGTKKKKKINRFRFTKSLFCPISGTCFVGFFFFFSVCTVVVYLFLNSISYILYILIYLARNFIFSIYIRYNFFVHSLSLARTT